MFLSLSSCCADRQVRQQGKKELHKPENMIGYIKPARNCGFILRWYTDGTHGYYPGRITIIQLKCSC